MKEFINKYKLFIIDYELLVLAFILSLFDLKNTAIVLLIVASGLFIKLVKDIVGNYMSFTVLFSGFHVLYGLAGVVSKCWLNQMSSTYGKDFIYSPYLIIYSLCTIALLTGIIISNRKHGEPKDTIVTEDNKMKDFFLFIAYCGFAVTSIFEIINFIRVGGIGTLLAGKAIYQAAVDELVLTLPTQYIFQVSFAALCIFIHISILNKEKIQPKKIIICVLLALPYLLMLILLVRRGPILVSIFMIMLAIFQSKPLKKIPIKLVIAFLIAYLVLGTLYAIRNNIGLLFTNFNEFKNKFDIHYVIRTLNPAVTEFGCTYGNFNRFYVKNNGKYDLLYGRSYVQGLFHVVPTYLYLGEKPQMITYEFRDKYFPAKAKISSIASTGFSSILEAYWNFWYFGALIYVIYGYILILLEKKLKNKNYFYMLEYISSVAMIYSFHRSEFGHSVSEIIIITLEIVAIYLFYKFIYNKENKLSKFIKEKIMKNGE